MALTSCYLQKDPTTEAILYLYFESLLFICSANMSYFLKKQKKDGFCF